MGFHVLLVCGSLQKRSANRAVLDVVRTYLERSGNVGVEDAEELGLIPAFNPDEQTQPVPAVTIFRDQVARCDGVIIASPEYAGAIAGGLKNALDWLVGSGELYSKPMVVLNAGTTGGQFALQQLIRTLTWQGAHVISQLGIAAPRTKSDAAGRFTDADTIQAIEQVSQQLLDVADMTPEERWAMVRELTESAGIEAGHIATDRLRTRRLVHRNEMTSPGNGEPTSSEVEDHQRRFAIVFHRHVTERLVEAMRRIRVID